jgi:hypothetical protein
MSYFPALKTPFFPVNKSPEITKRHTGGRPNVKWSYQPLVLRGYRYSHVQLHCSTFSVGCWTSVCNTATAGPAYHKVQEPNVPIFPVLAWLFTCVSFKDDALTTNTLYCAK